MATTKSNQELSAIFVQKDENKWKLLYEEETFTYWRFDGHVWNVYHEDMMRRDVMSLVWQCDPANRFTKGKAIDVVQQVADYLGENPVLKTMGTFGYRVEAIEEKGVSFNDGVFVFDKMELVPHGNTLDRLAFVHLDFNYADISKADAPLFKKYIRDTCTAADGTFNQGQHDQLQEWAGFVLSDERAEVCAILFGKGRNGKSPYIDLLRAMVGKGRHSAMTLDTLSDDKFSVPRLVGVKLNAASEDESKKVNVAMFKGLVSGEPMTARRLYQGSFDFKPHAKFMFSANKLMRMDGFDDATKERIFIIPFEHVMDKKDFIRSLGKRMSREELPYIVNWALEGLKRLKTTNCVFTQTPQSLAMMNQMEEANSSVMEYVNAEWVRDASYRTPTKEVYDGYLVHCRNTGQRYPLTLNKFSREGQKVLGEIKQSKIQGKNERCFCVRRIDDRDGAGSHIVSAPTGDPVADQYALDFNGEVVKEPDL